MDVGTNQSSWHYFKLSPKINVKNIKKQAKHAHMCSAVSTQPILLSQRVDVYECSLSLQIRLEECVIET